MCALEKAETWTASKFSAWFRYMFLPSSTRAGSNVELANPAIVSSWRLLNHPAWSAGNAFGGANGRKLGSATGAMPSSPSVR